MFGIVRKQIWNLSRKNWRKISLPLKSNRKIALGKADKIQGNYVTVKTLAYEKNTTRRIYLEGVKFPLLIVKTNLQERSW